jgi:hypothetical protein
VPNNSATERLRMGIGFLPLVIFLGGER